MLSCFGKTRFSFNLLQQLRLMLKVYQVPVVTHPLPSSSSAQPRVRPAAGPSCPGHPAHWPPSEARTAGSNKCRDECKPQRRRCVSHCLSLSLGYVCNCLSLGWVCVGVCVSQPLNVTCVETGLSCHPGHLAHWQPLRARSAAQDVHTCARIKSTHAPI